MAKELANILSPLVEHYQQHIWNTQGFIDQVKTIRLGKGSTLDPMMWRSSSHLFLWTHLSLKSSTSWNRKHNCITEVSNQYNTSQHCWSSASKLPISSSRIGTMNRCIKQLLDPLSAPLWPTSSWKNLKPRPPTHISCGSGMWMTPVSSKRQNTATSFYSTSTPLTLTYNLSKRLQNQMDYFASKQSLFRLMITKGMLMP